MLIRFTKAKKLRKPDVLTCVRDNGSSTWMRERHGFVWHDLAHYAAETTFGYRLGFFGLVAAGWELSSESFGRDPRTRQPLPWPDPAISVEPVEYVVSLLQREVAGMADPHEFHDALALYVGDVPPVFTGDRLDAARRRLRGLHRQWEAVAAGESLELTFPA
jgi:hypothetical protein